MKKIDDLRAALTAAIPELQRERGRLRIWIEDGSGSHRQTRTLAFGLTYRVNLLLVEMETDLALIVLPLFRWLRVNQPDLLKPGAEGFTFDADILDNRCADLLIQLQLTENVSVTAREDGGWRLDYLPEPDPMFDDEQPLPGLDDMPDLDRVSLGTLPHP